MKSVKAVLAIAGFSAALAFAGTAAAQSESSFYIGGTVGQSTLKGSCLGVDGCDNTDTAWRILGGYQFNRYFAVELGYHDFGKASGSLGDTKAKAWEVVGLASYPLTNEFSIYGKLGGYNGKLEAPNGDETTNQVTYGAGARYDFTKNVGVRGEWQRYHDMGGNNVVKTDVDVVSVGVLYRFQ